MQTTVLTSRVQVFSSMVFLPFNFVNRFQVLDERNHAAICNLYDRMGFLSRGVCTVDLGILTDMCQTDR